MNGGEARWACDLMSINPLSSVGVSFPCVSDRSLAQAIGGCAGWAEGIDYARWVNGIVSQIDGDGPSREPSLGLRRLMFMMDAVRALRDNGTEKMDEPGLWDSEADPRKEYVFCTSSPLDLKDLREARARRCIAWSPERLESCARGLLGAVEKALSQPGDDSFMAGICAAQCALEMSFIEGLRPELLDFLVKWAPSAGSAYQWGQSERFSPAYGDQGPQDEIYDVAQLSWNIVAQAPSMQEDSSFPWGVLLAWSMPSLLEEWGDALGVDWDREVDLTREICLFPIIGDDWDARESCAAKSALSAIERVALARLVSEPKKQEGAETRHRRSL